MNRLVISILVATTLGLAAVLPGFSQNRGEYLQLQARFLAGMADLNGTAFFPYANTPAYQEYAAELNEQWEYADNIRLSKMRNWAITEMQPRIYRPPAVYYPFSGPDFLTVDYLYPYVPTYVLAGLEPIGQVTPPENMQPEEIAAGLANLRKSLENLMKFSYFITKDMKLDLRQTKFNGVTPILYVFLARSNKQIVDLRYVSIGAGGKVEESWQPFPESHPIDGIRITFTSPGSVQPQILYYFQTDLSNGALQSNSNFLRFLDDFGMSATFLKSASYLMHSSGFSHIREFLLNNSTSILQDPSGIPLQAFPPQTWQMFYFGKYVGPIDLFQEHYQQDLAQAYNEVYPLPLPFGAGYQFEPGKSALILGVRRRDPQGAPAQ